MSLKYDIGDKTENHRIWTWVVQEILCLFSFGTCTMWQEEENGSINPLIKPLGAESLSFKASNPMYTDHVSEYAVCVTR